MTIVTSHYRYKRPPRKRKAVALDVPVIVCVASTQPRVSSRDDTPGEAKPAPLPANDARKSAIVTAKSPHRRGRFGDVPDMTPEEHKRRGDAADALFREMKVSVYRQPRH
jgi:hypothetical protein